MEDFFIKHYVKRMIEDKGYKNDNLSLFPAFFFYIK